MSPVNYVILRHEGVADPHFDLMFETRPGSELATWRSDRWPIETPTPLKRLKDHRRIYLDYEGELSGHRGRVHRVNHGQCHVDIGQDAVWSIDLVSGMPAGTRLVLRQLNGERWECSASMSA